MSSDSDTFDRSRLSAADSQILADFQQRREVFDRYIESEKLSLCTCPSCGYPTLSERGGYEICPVCNWEDDDQDDNDADVNRGGPNIDLSLTESRLIVGRQLNRRLRTGAELIMDPERVLEIIVANSKSLDSFLKTVSANSHDNDLLADGFKQHREALLDNLVETKTIS